MNLTLSYDSAGNAAIPGGIPGGKSLCLNRYRLHDREVAQILGESIPGKGQHHTQHRKFVWPFPGMQHGY